MDSVDLELHLLLKHIHQNVLQHEQHVKKIHKLQDKILANYGGSAEGSDVEVSAKGAVKLLQAYEAALKTCREIKRYRLGPCSGH